MLCDSIFFSRDSSIDEKSKVRKKSQKTIQDKRIADLQFKRRPSQMMSRFRNQFGVPGPDGANVNASAAHYIDIPDDDDDSDDESDDVIFSAEGNYRKYIIRRQPTHDQKSRRQLGRRGRDLPKEVSELDWRNENRNRNAIPIDDSTITTTATESDDTDDEISSGSSIDTDDLDFSYQDKKIDGFSSDDNDLFYPPKKEKLDLISDDIFSDYSDTSDYDTEDSDVSRVPIPPIPNVIRRQ